MLLIPPLREFIDPVKEPDFHPVIVDKSEIGTFDLNDVVAKSLDFKLTEERLQTLLRHPVIEVL